MYIFKYVLPFTTFLLGALTHLSKWLAIGQSVCSFIMPTDCARYNQTKQQHNIYIFAFVRRLGEGALRRQLRPFSKRVCVKP